MNSTVLSSKTNRGQEWIEFAKAVLEHIDSYTVPQYGDSPNDAVSKFSNEQIISSIERYCARFGKNAREGQDKLDLMKIAHYAAILSNKGNDELVVKYELDGDGHWLRIWIDENLNGDGNDYKCVITKIGKISDLPKK